MIKKNIKTVFFLIMIFFLFGCPQFGFNSRVETTDAKAKDENKIRRQFALRNFREMDAVMRQLTDAQPVPDSVRKSEAETMRYCQSNNALIRYSKRCLKFKPQHSEFYVVKDLLPRKNDIDSFGGPTQVGVFRLAAAYCDSLLNNKEIRERKFPDIFPSIDITADTSVLTPDIRTKIAGSFIDEFWGTDLDIRPNREESITTIKNMVDDLLTLEEANTENVLLGVCTAALASAPVTFY